MPAAANFTAAEAAVPSNFDRINKKAFFIRKASSSDYFGQVQTFGWDETIETTEEGRISDDQVYESRDRKRSRFNITLYLDNDMEEMGVMFGVTLNKATGWDGSTNIELTTTVTAFDLAVDVYNADNDNLIGSWTVDDWKPLTNQGTIGNDQGAAVISIDGTCDNFYFTGASGVGSTA